MDDLQEATIAMAILMNNEANFYDKYIKNKSSDIIHEKIIREYEYLQSTTREFGNILAANPNFFGIMESWKVYITGKEGANKNSVEKAYEENNVEILFEKCGNLAIGIKEYIKRKGLLICDISAGEDGWDIAVRCTEDASKNFCRDIYSKYIRAVEMRLLIISRRFAGHCLPGLYNWEDAKRILDATGENFNSENI